MILDFTVKLGGHKVMVNVSALECGKYRVAVQELDVDKKSIVDIDSTFISRYTAMQFAKKYVQEYLNEL